MVHSQWMYQGLRSTPRVETMGSVILCRIIYTVMRQERGPRLGKLGHGPIRFIRISCVIFNIKFSGVIKAFTGSVIKIQNHYLRQALARLIKSSYLDMPKLTTR